jgi:hypothetical protein
MTFRRSPTVGFAKLQEDDFQGPLLGKHFEMLVRHEHGGEALSKRSESFLVFLTKEAGKEPTLNGIVKDIIKATGRSDRSDAATKLLDRTAGELIASDAQLQQVADAIRQSGNAMWIADLKEFTEGKLKKRSRTWSSSTSTKIGATSPTSRSPATIRCIISKR